MEIELLVLGGWPEKEEECLHSGGARAELPAPAT